MREWKDYSVHGACSLEEFTRFVRFNKVRLRRLEEDLSEVRRLMIAIPGPVYGGIPGNHEWHDKMPGLMDREMKILSKIKAVEDSERTLTEFKDSLTDRESSVFVLYYFRDKTQDDIAFDLCTSQQYISQVINKINKKWEDRT